MIVSSQFCASVFQKCYFYFERINTMLKLKYLFENYDLAKEAVKNWAHDADTLDEMLSRFRISSNAIYPFCQNGKVCFLRLAPVDEKLEKNVLGEIEFINYLLKHNYPALEPMKAITGEDCLLLGTEWGEYYATAFKEVNGVQIEDTDMSDEIMYEYGKALGGLHSLSSEFIPKTKKWTHIEVLNWIESVLSEYNAPNAVVSALHTLKGELSLLPLQQDNYGLIHYDFELDNVFYNKETKTCAVIDFDDGMYHWYALDIEQVFESLEDELSGKTLQTAKNEFIRGYKEEYHYTQETEISLPLMRRFINLYAYARLIRCVAEKFAHEPEWLVELRKKLDKAILEKETSIVAS